MTNVPITLAVSHYDRHGPLLDGTVVPEGVDLTVLEIGQSSTGRHGNKRHTRMLRNGEFDAAEISFSNYLIARQQGKPFTAIPYVPRRLFTPSLWWTREDSPFWGPEALAGQRVGLNTFGTTLSVLAKGDLEHEYGVPWKDIHWVINVEEVVPYELAPGLHVERLPKDGPRIDDLLLAGDLAALAMPHPPSTIAHDRAPVRRLFADARGADLAYYRRNGYWPIMHFVAFRDDVLERHPWLARSMWDAFHEATRVFRDRATDPNWSSLAWGPIYQEEESALLGDPWTHGVAANRANIERFMTYSHEQGLIRAPMPVESLFHASLLDT